MFACRVYPYTARLVIWSMTLALIRIIATVMVIITHLYYKFVIK